jgi:2-polyprenyl-3-methyl-5-hydroxy-6-metoxy-1,4-benzoquinol methylase
MDSLIPDYRKLAETMSGNFAGLSVLNHVKSIKALASSVGAETLLDFGCGRGDAYRSPFKIHHQLGLPRSAVTLYDPAFRPSSALPTGKYDLVICSDVLEHLVPEETDEFITRLFGYARKAVWASHCSRPAKKFFPGTDKNLHTCVQPHEWWEEKFIRLRTGSVKWVLVETP